MHKIYLCQSFMHSWEPTECIGIQILTIKLLLVISIVFGFFGTLYRVYKKKRNLGISQEIDIVLKTKDFRRLK